MRHVSIFTSLADELNVFLKEWFQSFCGLHDLYGACSRYPGKWKGTQVSFHSTAALGTLSKSLHHNSSLLSSLAAILAATKVPR